MQIRLRRPCRLRGLLPPRNTRCGDAASPVGPPPPLPGLTDFGVSSRPITTQGNPRLTPIDVDMRTFYNFLGDSLHRGPSELLDRSSGLIIAILGTGILVLMAYAVLAAWS